MATEDRPHAPPLNVLEALARAPGRFDFYQALRRLEQLHRSAPRLGEASHPADEPLRLGQDPILAFAHNPIAGVSQDGPRPRVVTTFFGLWGPQGPMPLHLTEYARERLGHAGDATLARFADLFHHRLLSLYYRAWATAHPAVDHDRPEQSRFARYLGALFGAGPTPSRSEPGAPKVRSARLYHAGRHAPHPRNAEGLAAVIGDFFGVPARIEELVGEWIDVPPEARWRLGQSAAGLGRGLTAGARTWIGQARFRVVLGPLDTTRFQDLLPGSAGMAHLEALVKGYTGDQLAWDVRLTLDADSRRGWQLGKASRLGWDTRLGAGPSGGSSVTVTPPGQRRNRHG